MLIHIPGILGRDEVADVRARLEQGRWVDGRSTAGAQGAQVKRNLQLAVDDPVAVAQGERVVQALMRNPTFISAVLPLRTLAPLFNRYEGGGTYGDHVDGSIMHDARNRQPLRSDVSSTLFLSDPDEYEGGELTVVDTYGTHEVKLPAGDLIVYPGTSLHHVAPVTRGARLASFFWTQSLVRLDWHRTMLFELDQTIQRLRARLGDDDDTVALSGHYHNLMRLWAHT